MSAPGRTGLENPTVAVLNGWRRTCGSASGSSSRNAVDAVAGTAHPRIALGCASRLRNRLSVADNGRGVAAGHLQEIFAPFFTTKPDCSGIGLTLARQIALAHGSSIAARGNEVCATTFVMVIPATG